MKKLLLLFLLVLSMTLCLSSCQTVIDQLTDALGNIAGTTTPPDPTPGATGGYLDPTHKSGTYKVVWLLNRSSVIHFYEEGEMPEPPEVPDYVDTSTILVFKKWDKEVSPVTGATTYTAEYDFVTKQYTATYVMGTRKQTKKFDCGVTPTLPTPPPTLNGFKFACWDKEPEQTFNDVTFTAIYASVVSPEVLKESFYHMNGDTVWQDHGHRDMLSMTALYTLLLEEHENPQNSVVRDRIIKMIDALTGSESAPSFDCSTNWAYGITCAALAVAKDTPTVWNTMSATQKGRVHTMMQAFMYIISLGTSDYNAYHTGPGMNGNYKNNWNVNYALGNIPCMVFGVYYFGDGDVNAGATAVNDMLKSFDEVEYNRMLKSFETNGWRSAAKCWTTGAPEGTNGVDAKTMLISGGQAYCDNYLNPGTVTGGGSGVGVSNRGQDFTYSNSKTLIGTEWNKITLYEPEKIMQCMMDFTYSRVVVSEHWYGGERVSYIIDGARNPYDGKMGMSYELGLDNRSSCAYTGHNFNMTVVHLSAAKILTRYTVDGNKKTPVTDAFGNEVALYDFTEDAARWSRIQVGMEDFIFKLIHGYQSYVKYNDGRIWQEADYESTAGSGYRACKSIWRNTMLPLGDLPSADSYGW